MIHFIECYGENDNIVCYKIILHGRASVDSSFTVFGVAFFYDFQLKIHIVQTIGKQSRNFIKSRNLIASDKNSRNKT
jgi:hypothetical protein